MRIEALQKRKNVLMYIVRQAQEAKFMAEQQDCYGMAKIIDECERDISFKAEWLGEVISEIDQYYEKLAKEKV